MMKGVKWKEEFEEKDVGEMWQCLKDKLNEVVQECIPLRNVQTKNQPRWFCREVNTMSEKKRRAWDLWKKSKLESDKQKYKQLENGLKKMIRNKKRNMERKVAKKAKLNLKAFFTYINGNKRLTLTVTGWGPFRPPIVIFCNLHPNPL